jgi:hypothetical protein
MMGGEEEDDEKQSHLWWLHLCGRISLRDASALSLDKINQSIMVAALVLTLKIGPCRFDNYSA